MPTVSHFADENSRPMTRSVTRSSKNMIKSSSFTVLNDKPSLQKGGKAKQGLGGARRSALGDVTNRQSVANDNVTLNHDKVGPKKSVLAASKNRVLRKAAPTTMLSPPPQQFSNSASVNNSMTKGRKSTSPMSISNDMDILDLAQNKMQHDIDSQNQDDANSVWKYAEDICNNFLMIEKSFTCESNYMANQLDVNSKMRAILIDWLVDVHAKFRLEPQTLYITINLLDRYLSKDLKVPRHRLQLFGITCMFVASKYEEIYPPDVLDFVRITDNAYTSEEVFECEEALLKQLGYRLACPTVFQFLMRFIKASGSTSKETLYFANYIVDRTLQEYKMIKYLPSQIAAAAVFIARNQFNEQPYWHTTLEYHTKYNLACLEPCIQEIKQIVWSSYHEIGKMSKLNAVTRKFNKEKYLGVGNIHLDNPMF